MKAIILILLVSALAFPQKKGTADNNVYLELLGSGLFSSINYEHTYSNNFTMRFGVGWVFSNSVSNSGGHHSIAFFPLAMGNYLIDIYGNNYLEIGGGFLIAASELTFSDTFNNPTNITIVPTFALGYRYSPKDGGVFFSIAFDLFTYPPQVMPWAGLGFGYKF